MTKSLREKVLSYSTEIGNDLFWVQGAGGNISWKENSTLWIKASGSWLADAEKKDIFLPVDFHVLIQKIHLKKFDDSPIIMRASQLKPSIETILHAILPHQIVVHTHPIRALAVLVQKNAKKILSDKLGDDFFWDFVPYYQPGPQLAHVIFDSCQSILKKDPAVIFLGNHGLLVGANHLEDIMVIQKQIDLLLEVPLRRIELSGLPVIDPALRKLDYTAPSDPLLQGLAFDHFALSVMENHWALYPDHVVFLGKKAPIYKNKSALIERIEKGDPEPEIIILPFDGVYWKKNISLNRQALLWAFLQVLLRQQDLNNLVSLSEQAVFELLSWKSEHHRMACEQ